MHVCMYVCMYLFMYVYTLRTILINKMYFIFAALDKNISAVLSVKYLIMELMH